jgi:putative endonuclease
LAKHIELGKKGEILAVEYLQGKGYQIIEKNWKYKRKEIDLIARKNNLIIVVEVKTRSSDAFGHPEEAVNRTKQKYLIEAADQYLQQLNYDAEVRYDIISIILSGEDINISHFKEAFIPLLN